MPTILLKGGNVFDGKAFKTADVLIENDKVQKIAPDIKDAADFIYNVSGSIVSSGFIDIHAHIRHINSDTYGAPADAVCLPFGVTAVVDSAAEKGDKSVAERFAVNALCFARVFVNNDIADFAVADKMIAAYGDKCLGYKIFFTEENKKIETIKPLKQVCERAKEKGLKVMAHTTGSPVSMAEIVETLNPGDILTHAFHGGNNTIDEDNFAAFRLAKEKGIFLDLAPAGFTHIDYMILKNAIENGLLPDTISTDLTKNSAMKRGGNYSLLMCMSMLRSLGMSEEEIFRAVTCTPAKAIGKASEWGSLAPGKRADISVIEYTDEPFSITDKFGNHLESQKGYRANMTIINGEILYRR